MYGPAALDISQKLGKQITLKTSSGFDIYREKLQQQNYDIAVIQPFDYPLVVEELGYIPLAQIKVNLRAVVIVKEDSPYRSLADLKGKRVAMAPQHAATSRQGMWALNEADLLEAGEISIDYRRSHDACLHALQVDNADACITGPPPFKDFVNRTGAKLRVLMTTDPIPHILAVAHPRVPPEDRNAVASIMSQWEHDEAGRKILEKMRFPGWKQAEPEQYAIMRQYLELETVQPAQAVQRSELVYGSFPYFAPRVLAEQMAPMVASFSTVMGREVHFRTTPSFERFKEYLAQGKYDIALIRPYDYPVARVAGYVPVARVAPNLMANFYVRADSGYNELADLKGQVIAFPPSTAVINIIGQTHLKKAGLDYVPAVRAGHDACMTQMKTGRAAACVTADITARALGYEEGKEVRIVATTDPVPNVLFVAHKRLSEAIQQRLTRLVVGWNDSDEGQQIIRRTGFGSFSEVNISDYEALQPQ
jgi:phosphonate transport system substrate-binding protein